MSTDFLLDSRAMAGRQLRRARRNPGLIAVTQAMPLMLLLFFGYVFGSTVALPGGADYRTYIVPGLFAVTAAGGLVTGMLTAAADSRRGVLERLRSLPMSRTAVPLGQACADVLLTAVGLVPLLAVGYAVGWRIEAGAAFALAAAGLLLLLRFTTAWIGFHLGMAVGSEEAAGQLASTTFVLQLLSNAYVPAAGLPGWLRTVVEWNPLSAYTTATRELFGSAVPGLDDAAGAAWPMTHPVAASLLWSAVLLAVFVPLAVRRYARTTAR
ncbi:Daunorubicin/doxorubicin resistance ABC transporter permease protein DrrB [Streptomyces sp. RB5]|uniref:Transport permease protein n=1 Tax=Streptomyces smaragdinus TaxID=2585196 RepID=A0A7K0CKA3_9ACTN|nr:ABC transporter permease [Streptomyces smaragdinus]MQY13204.1 Daunorubicin/doxorubicin resistance ABC transporter permease protein DrrB [Streptomyces smaragdinus]